jgi:hypothetical protein
MQGRATATERALDDLRAIAEEIKVIGMLHHADALIPILAPRVGTANYRFRYSWGDLRNAADQLPS